MLNSYNKLIFRVLSYNKVVTHQYDQTFKSKCIIGYQLFTQTLYQGTSQVINDFQKYRSLSNTTCENLFLKTQIRQDLIKVAPFLIVLLLPGGTLFIPPYVTLFPNAIPSQYLFESQYQERVNIKQKSQELSLNYLYNLQNIIKSTQKQEIQELFENRKSKFDQMFNIYNMNSSQLIHVCKILQMEFISGTHIFKEIINFFLNIGSYLNNLFNLITNNPNRQPIKNYFVHFQTPFYVEMFKKKILIAQIEQQLKLIQEQDSLYKQNDNNFEIYAKQRGLIKIKNKQEYMNDWLQYKLNNKLNINQQIWYAILISKSQ